MSKIVGYVLAIVGLVGVAAWAIPEVKKMIPNLNQVGDTTLVVVSGAIVLLGLILAMKGRRGRRGGEVPIYHGRDVVGYRRH